MEIPEIQVQQVEVPVVRQLEPPVVLTPSIRTLQKPVVEVPSANFLIMNQLMFLRWNNGNRWLRGRITRKKRKKKRRKV
jgi:hypothetical protein